MTSREFCYWLQGYFEIEGATPKSYRDMTPESLEVIKRHLNLVFKHEIDPSYGDEAHQEELNAVHNPDSQFGETGFSGKILRC